MSKLNWTKADQTQLDALIARKEEFERASMEPLLAFTVRMLWTNNTPDEIARYMRNNADEIRDALAPFDSGNRPAVQAKD